jgi:hypothetical protein
LNQMCLNSMAPLTLLSFLPCDDSESIAKSYTQQRGGHRDTGDRCEGYYIGAVSGTVSIHTYDR